MLKVLSTRLLQHLISQNTWASALLQPFASKSVQINIGAISTTLLILENGNLAIAGETNISDAKITITPTLLLRLLSKDEAANRQIIIEGDTQLAAELAKVFSNIRWDYEDDLSNFIGDISANKIGSFVRDASNSTKEATVNIAEMLSEYWQEEMPLIAKKRHVEQFYSDVDNLRANVARLEKKLAKLSRSISNNLPSNTETNSSAVDSIK